MSAILPLAAVAALFTVILMYLISERRKRTRVGDGQLRFDSRGTRIPFGKKRGRK